MHLRSSPQGKGRNCWAQVPFTIVMELKTAYQSQAQPASVWRIWLTPIFISSRYPSASSSLGGWYWPPTRVTACSVAQDRRPKAVRISGGASLKALESTETTYLYGTPYNLVNNFYHGGDVCDLHSSQQSGMSASLSLWTMSAWILAESQETGQKKRKPKIPRVPDLQFGGICCGLFSSSPLPPPPSYLELLQGGSV